MTLAHVLWIGGAPGSGKTTLATALARRHGLRWYGADTRTWVHRDRALAAGIEAAARWERLTPAERWEIEDDEDLLALSLHRERGPMVVEDLRQLPASPLVVAEGSTLPAAAVSSGAADPTRAVWLIPTRDFQDAQLCERALPAGPTRVYRLFRQVIEQEARDHGAPVLAVDGSRTLAQTVALVEERFSAALHAGPVATTSAERRALLREANESIVMQVRGFHARPWAGGDAETAVRDFLCECGDPACEATLELSIAAAADRPALARGHRRATTSP